MSIKVINPIINAVDPNLQEKTITENGEYTADEGYDGLSKVTVDVKGGASVEPKYINFFDYDGTILYSYTEEELNALTELPPLPEHDGLICQGWNWTLDELKAEGKETDVGAMYITDDGATRLYVTIDNVAQTVKLYFKQSVANGVTVDWGDGSATEKASTTAIQGLSHAYAETGDYVITLTPADGCDLTLGYSSSYGLLGGDYTYPERVPRGILRKVECGRVKVIEQYCFRYCYNLETITISQGVTTIGEYQFTDCYYLKSVTIPTSVTSIPSYCFSGAGKMLQSIILPNGLLSIGTYLMGTATMNIKRLTIPNSVTSIGRNFLYEVHGIKEIIVPLGVTKINQSFMNNSRNCRSVKILGDVTSVGTTPFLSPVLGVVDFTACTSVPTLSGSFGSTNPSYFKILVPSALYDEWISATNWSAVADKIVPV